MQDADQVPPHNLDAERELLGSLLAFFNPATLATCRAVIEREDFYWKAHEIIWRAICAVADAGDHVDLMTVSRFLARTRAAEGSFLDVVGGEARLELLAAHTVTHGLRERAEMIHEDAVWRQRLREAQEKEQACYLRDQSAYDAAGGEQPRLKLVS